jgi:hypothetical protein
MKFNALKCKVLTITRKKSPVTTDYHLGDANLQRVQQEKDLGIMSQLILGRLYIFSCQESQQDAWSLEKDMSPYRTQQK